MREIVKRETIEISVGVCFNLVLWCRWRACVESMPVVLAGYVLEEDGADLRVGAL